MPKNKSKNLSKERKKGESGIAPQYITRTRAVRKLQISLKDFRRLCILKGIYPRDPKKKNQGKGKTYYHIKDIKFLAHEPLLKKFRELKSFLKKHRRHYERKNHSQVQRMLKEKPRLTYDHLVRERYPQFVDALRDLDDPLCMIHLYAAIPSGTTKHHKPGRADMCLQLCREFQNYVIHTKGLRKVFVSIKGYYYQAQIESETVTWLIPHKFTFKRPRDVDYRVLLTFLDFYETFVKFVNFKLYHNTNLVYPPELDTVKDDAGGGLNVVRIETETELKARQRLEKLKLKEKKLNELAEIGRNYKTKPCRQFEKKGSCQYGDKCKFLHPGEKSRVQNEADRSAGPVTLDPSLLSNADLMDVSDEEVETEEKDAAVGQEFKELEDEEDQDGDSKMNEVQKSLEDTQKKTKLFGGLKFLLCREVPRDQLEFIIKCGSGEVVFIDEAVASNSKEQEPNKPSASEATDLRDNTITHQVTDRPDSATQLPSREYIQPQWIFDSFNESFLLPTDPYAPNKTPPPHLSPFVDDQKAGYVPKQREILDRWKQGKTGEELAGGGSDEGEAQSEDEETRYEEDLKREKIALSAAAVPSKSTSPEKESPSVLEDSSKVGGNVVKGDEDSDVDEEDDEEDGEEESEEDMEDDEEDDSGSDNEGSDDGVTVSKKRKLGEEGSDLPKIMMSKKDTRLYSRMQFSNNKTKEHNRKLLDKRRKHERTEKKKAKKQKTK